MTAKYVVQFLEDGSLIKDFRITEKCPIPSHVPEGRTQIFLDETGDETFYFLVEQYAIYGKRVKFNLDCTIREITEVL